MDYQRITFEKQDGIAKITLNRPEKLNAIDEQTVLDLQAVIDEIERDDTIRVVILASTGRAWSAGADLARMRSIVGDANEMYKFARLWHQVFNSFENLGKPTIAAIQGFVLAGGLELMMVCDLAVASEQAQIGDAHANYGMIPGGGGTQRLPRLIGLRRAKELMFTGDFLSAKEAERFGLVNKVVPADRLEAAVMELAQKIAEKSPLGLRHMKYLANSSREADLHSGLDMEILASQVHFSSEDAKEGTTAFVEKRKPVFRGR